MDLLPDFTASEHIDDIDVPTFSKISFKQTAYSKAKPLDARGLQAGTATAVSGRFTSTFPDEAPVFAAIARKRQVQPPSVPIVSSKPVHRLQEQQENVPQPAETVARLRSTVSKLKSALEASERARIEAEAQNDKLRLAFAEQEREIERLRGCLEARAASSRHSMRLLNYCMGICSIQTDNRILLLQCVINSKTSVAAFE